MAVLAGDLGATKTVLAIFDGETGVIAKQSYASRDFRSFDSLLSDFLKKHPHAFRAACFGAPGPVIDGVVRTTHLPWKLDVKELRKTLRVPVGLLNDVECAAFGLSQLLPNDTVLLSKARHHGPATRAIVAPGTGLGEAILHWTGTHYDVIPSEGGHADFAPTTALEWELKSFLRDTLGYTGTEAVVSGEGLRNIYDFLKHHQVARQDPEVRDQLKRIGAIAISDAARRGDALSRAALDIFAHALALECQRVALAGKALGGVYIAGGIAAHVLPLLTKPRFMQLFTANKRMRGLLERIPVHVVLNPDVNLLGAVHVARTRVR